MVVVNSRVHEPHDQGGGAGGDVPRRDRFDICPGGTNHALYVLAGVLQPPLLREIGVVGSQGDVCNPVGLNPGNAWGIREQPDQRRHVAGARVPQRPALAANGLLAVNFGSNLSLLDVGRYVRRCLRVSARRLLEPDEDFLGYGIAPVVGLHGHLRRGRQGECSSHHEETCCAKETMTDGSHDVRSFRAEGLSSTLALLLRK
jgi:hypothetical protein